MKKLKELEEKAQWHEGKAEEYINNELPYSQGAAQFHQEQAQKLWMEYGRLVAELESRSKWEGQKIVVLVGRTLG